MRRAKRNILWCLVGLLVVVGLWTGWLKLSALVWGVVAAALLLGLLRVGGPRALGQQAFQRLHRWLSSRMRPQTPPAPPPTPASVAESIRESDPDALVRRMLAQGRYSLLLRRQLIGGLAPAQIETAQRTQREEMALVPEGEVVLEKFGNWIDPRHRGDADSRRKGTVVRVEHVFIDRYPVTNRRYFEFVAAGGYEQMAIWDPEILPALMDFVDRSGAPGPRFWSDGHYPPGEEDLPVTGVSWFEAVAYCRWVGKRLPSDAEWVKAGSWPVRLSNQGRIQRRFPWGDSVDHTRANLFGSKPGRVVSVKEFSTGVSVGGVHQMIGNVWEWTASSLTGPDGGMLASATPLRSLRGGAFDTYFDSQTTCDFQSGDNPVVRKHNIGFRCALSVCDLAGTPLEKLEPTAKAKVPDVEEEDVALTR